jgi:catechol 2,3-dioxygenase-like lactoylglutathione lyase family enzyme
MAIIGTHGLLYTSEPDALRACLRDVFGWPNVDAGGGWLIFTLPPAELGVHPADGPAHQLSFICDDIGATMAELGAKGIGFRGEPTDQGFGICVTMMLPGVEVMLYEPKHPTAITR